VKICCDGSYTPHGSGIGIAVWEDNNIIGQCSLASDECTSYKVEKDALLAALLWGILLSAEVILTDNKTLSARWKTINSNIPKLYPGRVSWISRNLNKDAHNLAIMKAFNINWLKEYATAKSYIPEPTNNKGEWIVGTRIVRANSDGQFRCTCEEHKKYKKYNFKCRHIISVMNMLGMI
jgi:ribonuclease HI